MLILLFVLVLAAFVVFLKILPKIPETISYSWTKRDFFLFMSVISGVGALLLFGDICYQSFKIATAYTIDDKIEMYQEENANIEQDIDKIVQAYLEHEHNTFTDLKTEESFITLVTLFPELNSDTLVQQQLSIYVNNNAKIKKLREEKIEIAKSKWILYFGR